MSLIAHYRLEGNANDEINNLNGTGSGVSYIVGKLGQAMAAGYATISNDSKLQIVGSLSIAFWVNVHSSGTRETLIGKSYGGEFTINVETPGDLRFYSGTGGGNATPYVSLDSSSLSTDTWHLAVIRKDETGYREWWIDGSFDGQSSAGDATAIGSTSNFDVKLRGGYLGDGQIDADLDDVRIYNHYLSDKEIKELWHAKIMHYVFNESGSTIYDISGQKNHSNAVSGTTFTEDNSVEGGGYRTFDNTSDDYIQAFTPSEGVTWLDSEDLHGITIFARIRSPDSSGEAGARIISRDASDWWAIILQQNEAFPQDIIFYSENVNETVNNLITQNEWHDIAMTRDTPNSETKYFIDGEKVGATDTSTSGVGSSRGVTIGHNEENGPSTGSSTSAFNGDMADIRIYMNTLSEDDIAALSKTRGSIDDEKNFWGIQFIETKSPDKRLCDWYNEWVVGTGGFQGSFGHIGDVAENDIISGTDPWGNTAKLWKATPDANSNADGGWNKNFTCDPTKRYRMSVWIKRTGNANGSTYFGCANIGSATENLAGTVVGNPYFKAGDPPSYGDWYLWVGLLHPYDYPDGASEWGVSGVYDTSGTKRQDGTEFKIASASITTQRHRSYFYYCTNTSNRQYWCYPRIDVIDGSEPSIMDLCAGIDSRYYNFNAETSGDSQVKGLAVRNSAYIQTISEVGPTSGLHSWFKMNGDATDVVGHYDGTLNGSPDTVQGIESTGLEFDADTKYIELDVNCIPNTSQITIVFWALKYSDTTANRLIELFDSSNNRVINIHLVYNNGNTYWDCGNDGGSSYDRIQKANPSVLNKWHHWGFTKNVVQGTMKIYLDGVLWHSDTGMTRAFGGYSNNGRIANAAEAAFNLDAVLDDFRIYDRELPPEEINALYEIYNPNSETKAKIMDNGIVYAKRFKEGL